MCEKTVELIHYEDSFYLVEKVKYLKKKIIIEPKSNLKSLFVTEKYNKAIIVDNCDCR